MVPDLLVCSFRVRVEQHIVSPGPDGQSNVLSWNLQQVAVKVQFPDVERFFHMDVGNPSKVRVVR